MTRHSAMRPRNGVASRLVTSACNPCPGWYVGAGIRASSRSKSGCRSVPGTSRSIVAGTATMDLDVPGTDLQPLFDLLLARIPAPTYQPGHGLQALVTNLDATPFLGRIALCRVMQGTIHRAQMVAWCRQDGTIQQVRVGELLIAEALERVSVEEAGPGEIIA